MACVIKHDHKDGVKLPRYERELWCGKLSEGGHQWHFQDAQHAALADKPICNKCRGNIIKALRG